MPDEIRQVSESVNFERMFRDMGEYFAEEIVAVNPDGSPIGGGGGGESSTELPEAAALIDGAPNPTTPTVGSALLGYSGGQWWRIRCNPPSLDAVPADQIALQAMTFMHGFNGDAWDRIRGDVTNGLDVDVTRLPAGPTTGTTTSVANAIASGTLLAANAARKGATIFNEDTAGTGATLKVKLGATASASSFTYAIAPMGYYEVPYGYTGIVTGIASAATGDARVTELT